MDKCDHPMHYTDPYDRVSPVLVDVGTVKLFCHFHRQALTEEG